MNSLSDEARASLDRLHQSTDAIEDIVKILTELPDWEMRMSVITYLYKVMQTVESDDGA